MILSLNSLKYFSLPLVAAAVLMAMPVKSFAAPTEQEFKTIMNLSGKQRMLSQKMAKEALLVAKGIDADANRKSLKETADLFKKTLTGLKDGDDSLGLPKHDFARIKAGLEKVQAAYNELDPIYTAIEGGAAPTPENLKVIAQKSPEVLSAADKVVSMFELEAKAVSGVGNQELAARQNIAGRQRMLSQKMTAEFLLTQLGVNAADNAASMKDTMNLFENSLGSLKDGNAAMGIPTGIKETDVLAQLGVVEKAWAEFKPLLTAATPDFDKIKTLNMTILKESDKAVQMLSK